MNNFRYDNENDAYQHLHQTVLLTASGIPFYIAAMELGTWKWKVLALGDSEDKNEQIDIRELGITFEPIQLGYCNYPDFCTYLVRRPVRMWKQGLSPDHIKAKSGYIDEGIITSHYLYNTILGSYPSPEESYRRVVDIGGSCAFNRDFAFSSPLYPVISLEYKGEVIGDMNENGDLEIKDKFFFVKEQLEEVLHEAS